MPLAAPAAIAITFDKSDGISRRPASESPHPTTLPFSCRARQKYPPPAIATGFCSVGGTFVCCAWLSPQTTILPAEPCESAVIGIHPAIKAARSDLSSLQNRRMRKVSETAVLKASIIPFNLREIVQMPPDCEWGIPLISRTVSTDM